jgi:hypothetical protein
MSRRDPVTVVGRDEANARYRRVWQTLRQAVANSSHYLEVPHMKPVLVGVAVPQPREDVFAYLDVLSNHEVFTDHMLLDWTCSGPASGVGAKARVRAKAPGKAQWIDMTAIASTPPESSVEESVGAGGRRRTRGTYTLEQLPNGGTAIEFRLDFLELPPAERLLLPLIRLRLKCDNAKALRRLKETLAHLASSVAAA